MDKQIFAALEIADHEIRLIVGEFFNTRFNIIKVERVNTSGIQGQDITNKALVVAAIQKAVINASRLVGAKIENVLLAIPAKNAKRVSVKVSVETENHRVGINDVRQAVKQAGRTAVEKDLALVNVVCVKYTCNGIQSRRIPLNEYCDELLVDVDLLLADKTIAFDYVACVEKAGLHVLDISLEPYAIAKEAALFEQTMDQNLILLKLERQSMTLALLSHGKLASVEVLEGGLNEWIAAVQESFGLPQDVACRLLKYNLRLNQKKYSEDPVYLWSKDKKTYTISEKQLNECVREKVDEWIYQLDVVCKPILSVKKTAVVIAGEGGEFQELAEAIQEKMQVDVKVYCPETIGVRTSSLSACLGLFYAYKDMQPVSENTTVSISTGDFLKAVNVRSSKGRSNDEDSITKKLKGMLFEAKSK